MNFILNTLWELISISLPIGISLIIFSLILGIINSILSKKSISISKNEIIRKDEYLKTLKSFDTNFEKSSDIKLRKRYGMSMLTDISPLLPLIIQIPILLSSYYFISSNDIFVSEGFLFISDLSKPDRLLFGLNVLPILMTFFNILSAKIDSRIDKKQKKISYVISLFFLIILYEESSALLIYWTIANLLMFLKVFIKLNKFYNLLDVILLYSLIESLHFLTKDPYSIGFVDIFQVFLIVFSLGYVLQITLSRIGVKNKLVGLFLTFCFLQLRYFYNVSIIYPIIISIIFISIITIIYLKREYLKRMITNSIDSRIIYFLYSLILIIITNLLLNRSNDVEIEDVKLKGFDVISSDEKKPNILHIVLDAYPSESVLKNVYDFDNRDFIELLISKGFKVSNDSSTSNYSQTHLSLSSMLNLSYLDIPKSIKTSRDITYNLIKNNRSGKFLQKQGYDYYHFISGWGGNQESDIADFNVSGDFSFFGLTDNTLIFLTKTGFSKITRKDKKAKRIINKLDEVDYLLNKESKIPKYLFVHLLLPHPPYVFDESFNPLLETPTRSEHGDVWLEKENYIQSIKATNSMIIKYVLGKYISNESKNNIIILSSDHGTNYNLSKGNNDLKSKQERLGNFTAIHNLNVDINIMSSPVNLYRILFNELFHTNLDTLTHKSYFSSYDNPYLFENISTPNN